MLRQHRTYPDRIAVVVLAIMTAAAAACLPIPNTERVSPLLTGVLRNEDGTGVQGIALGVGCTNPVTRTTTDSLGRFRLPEVTQQHSWLPIIGDMVYAYRLCALTGDSGTVIYSWYAVQQAPPKTQMLVCTAALRPVPNTACRKDQ